MYPLPQDTVLTVSQWGAGRHLADAASDFKQVIAASHDRLRATGIRRDSRRHTDSSRSASMTAIRHLSQFVQCELSQ